MRSVEFVRIRAFSASQLSGARPRERARGHAVSTLPSLPNPLVLLRRNLVCIIRENIPVWRELVSREFNEVDMPSVKPRSLRKSVIDISARVELIVSIVLPDVNVSRRLI